MPEVTRQHGNAGSRARALSLVRISAAAEEFGVLHPSILAGSTMSSAKEAVLDEGLIKSAKAMMAERIYVDGRDLPTDTGLYFVDRRHGRLIMINEAEGRVLQWHEKLRVRSMTHPLFMAMRPYPVLYIDLSDHSEMSLGAAAGRLDGFAAVRYSSDRIPDARR